MSWTDERIDQLSRLWLDGRSASQIATAMGGGLTRNAVIGKVHRLGLAGRVKSTVAAPGGLDSANELQSDADEAAGLELVGGSRRAAPRQSVAAVSSAPASAVASARVQGNTALAMAEAPAEAAKPARAPEEVVVPMSLKVTIVDLRESMCKWPLGDPSSMDFRYCGSPSHTGTPYCQYHGKIAYQPAQDRRRERDRRPLLAR
ncbi:MAG: GcrA cell cycle regulator [Pseudomonadota bacterium]|nr:GcrA cell cycle regulator [Pseudomonadota bacterium]